MKVKVSVWRITWRYLIVSLIVLGALFGVSFTLFITVNEAGETIPATWGVGQYMLVIFAGVALLFFYFLSIFSYYYVIEKDHFVLKRYWKEYQFDYKNIEFIDIEESKRKKQVIFYSPKSKTRYLLGDKDGVLLDTLIKKCPNTMSVPQFRAKHPEERY